MENPIKMDDLGVPLFLETPISDYIPWIKQWIQMVWIHHLKIETSSHSGGYGFSPLLLTQQVLEMQPPWL